MTEHTKKHTLGRSARIALVAAAVAAALGITATAAEIPAVREFFSTIVTVTVRSNDSSMDGISIGLVGVEERDGRTILLMEDGETDITDALERDGEYRAESGDYEVTVDENGVATVTTYASDGTLITYSIPPEGERETTIYEVTTDVRTDALQTEGPDTTTYNIVTDPSGAISVTDAAQ